MAERDRTLSFVDHEGRPTIAAKVLYMAVAGGDLHQPVGRFPLTGIDRVTVGRGSETRALRTSADSEDGTSVLRIEIADGWLSSRHAELTPTSEAWLLRDLGSKNGTFVDGAPISADVALADDATVEVGSSMLIVKDAHLELSELEDVTLREGGLDATLSLTLARVLARARAIAPSDVPVILGGPSGTGKELLARYIHRHSGRGGSFVGVNCGAIAPGLVASALFGHRKGAFSGASSDHPGLFRAADRGTLLLDEVGELSNEAQAALLRALQEREVVAVGDSRPISVDARVIAASLRPLEQEVEAGKFRHDLHMRLAGLQLDLPPLCDRMEDLGVLLVNICRRRQLPLPALTRETLRLLFAYSWPGNVRELEQVAVAAIELAAHEGRTVGPEHLPDRLKQVETTAEEDLRQQLHRALVEHAGNISAVARHMGRARVQIRRWCKRFGIDIEGYRR